MFSYPSIYPWVRLKSSVFAYPWVLFTYPDRWLNATMDKYERRRLRLLWIKDQLCNKKVADLAKRLGKSDTYVHRMLYPEGKESKKNIGEDSVDLVLEKFGINLDEGAPGAVSVAPKMFYQWVSEEESQLISDLRTSSAAGRNLILGAAASAEKIITPANSIDNQR